MSDFIQKPKRFGGNDRGASFNRGGGRPDFKGRGDRQESFPATCANCHKQCDVPFRPNGSKPVYCKDCFRAMKDEASGEYSRPNENPKRDFSSSQQRPVNDSRIDELKRQIEALHVKLDKVLHAVGGNQHVAPKVQEKKVEFSAPAVIVSSKEEKKEVVKKLPAKKKAATKKK